MPNLLRLNVNFMAYWNVDISAKAMQHCKKFQETSSSHINDVILWSHLSRGTLCNWYHIKIFDLDYQNLVKNSNPLWQYKQYVDWISTKWNAHILPVSPLAIFLSAPFPITNGSNKSRRMNFSIDSIDCWLKKQELWQIKGSHL